MVPKPPGVGLTVARGAGWGSLAGGIGGYFLPFLSALATGQAVLSDVGIFLIIGFYAAPIGMVWGLLAGLGAALAVYPLIGRSDSRLMIRVIAAAAGVLVTVLMSTAIFRPSLVIGGNETISHVRERIFTFYLIPGVMALLVGLSLGPRVLRPALPDDQPASEIEVESG